MMSDWTTPKVEEEEEKSEKWAKRIKEWSFWVLAFSLIITNFAHSKSFPSWVHVSCCVIQILGFGFIFLKIENMQTALRPLAIWYKNKFQLKSYDASVSIKGWLHIAFVCLFIMVFFYGLYALIGISIFNFFTE